MSNQQVVGKLLVADELLERLLDVPMSANQRNAIVAVIDSVAFLPDGEVRRTPQLEHYSDSKKSCSLG